MRAARFCFIYQVFFRAASNCVLGTTGEVLKCPWSCLFLDRPSVTEQKSNMAFRRSQMLFWKFSHSPFNLFGCWL